MITIHPRHRIVSEARSKIVQPIAAVVKEFDLTYGELFSIIAGEMQEWANILVRHERANPEDEEE